MIKDGCQSGRKVVPHDSKSDLALHMTDQVLIYANAKRCQVVPWTIGLHARSSFELVRSDCIKSVCLIDESWIASTL